MLGFVEDVPQDRLMGAFVWWLCVSHHIARRFDPSARMIPSRRNS
jgi:hypothetical protein